MLVSVSGSDASTFLLPAHRTGSTLITLSARIPSPNPPMLLKNFNLLDAGTFDFSPRVFGVPLLPDPGSAGPEPAGGARSQDPGPAHPFGTH